MRLTKTIFALILILAVLLTGCSKGKNDDSKIVIAKVNGESITKGELLEQYDREKGMFGITEDMEGNEAMQDQIKQFKLDVLDNMINNKIVLQKANENGFKKDDSYFKEAEAFYNDMVKKLAAEMEKNAAAEPDPSSEDDYNKQAKEYIDDYLDQNGWTMDEYLDIVADQIFMDKFCDSIVADVKAAEEDIREYYYDQLEEQTGLGYAKQGQVSIVHGDQVKIKYILIDLPYEVITEYQTKLTGGDSEGAKDFINEKLAELKPDAEEILSRLNNGESFENLLEEVNPGVWVDELENGYLMSKDDPYLVDIEDTVFSMKKDEVSDIVETMFGYFIIKAYELVDAKTYTLEEKNDEIEAFVTDKLKSEKLKELIDDWVNQSEIKIFEDKLENPA